MDTGGRLVIDRMKATLEIDHIKMDAEGRYECTTSDYSISAAFEVKVIPSALRAERSFVVAYEGALVKLKCIPSGHVPWVSWYHVRDKVLPTNRVATQTLLTGRKEFVLKFSPVIESDEGMYTCRSLFPKKNSAPVYLKVKKPPTIRRDYLSKVHRQLVGREFELKCVVEAEEIVDLAWKHYNTKLDNIRLEHAFELVLVFRALKKADGGLYSCVAKSENHTDTYEVTIIVLGTKMF